MVSNVQDITLKMPKQIVDSLPADSDATKQDMQKAMGGWEQDLNTALNVDDEMVSAIVDIIERF